jgi:IgA Peptidase M64
MATPIPAGITLETVLYNGPSKDKKNLLFLGDGFSSTPADRQLFDKTIDEIILRLFRRAPYNLRGVKNAFNIFKAFTPSPSSGISCAVEVDANGLTMDTNGAGPSIGKLLEKHSALGLTYGAIINGAPLARLIAPKPGDENLIMSFIATLSLPVEAVADTAIPDCWAKPPAGTSSLTGKDHALVVVLVNDDKYGGGGHVDFAMACLGNERGFKGLVSTAAGTDHTPGSPRNNFNNLASVSMHELGHSHFGLKDEYSEINTPATATTKGFFADNPNAVTKADITNAAGDIDPVLLKWNKEAFPGSADKLVSTTAFTHMQTNKKPLWERPPGTVCATVGNDTSTKYPPKSIWHKIRYPQRIIGAYEGGAREACGVYSPAGSCRMRSAYVDSDFCYVCKHAIIEKIDASLLPELYKKFYPK